MDSYASMAPAVEAGAGAGAAASEAVPPWPPESPDPPWPPESPDPPWRPESPDPPWIICYHLKETSKTSRALRETSANGPATTLWIP